MVQSPENDRAVRLMALSLDLGLAGGRTYRCCRLWSGNAGSLRCRWCGCGWAAENGSGGFWSVLLLGYWLGCRGHRSPASWIRLSIVGMAAASMIRAVITTRVILAESSAMQYSSVMAREPRSARKQSRLVLIGESHVGQGAMDWVYSWGSPGMMLLSGRGRSAAGRVLDVLRPWYLGLWRSWNVGNLVSGDTETLASWNLESLE